MNQSRQPLDLFPYERDPRSRQADSQLPDGTYVYVQDLNGEVWVLPDGPHLHPKVLGGARSALFAGDLTIESRRIVELTNCSGSFRFDDAAGLLAAADALRRQGLPVVPGSLRRFPEDGGPIEIVG